MNLQLLSDSIHQEVVNRINHKLNQLLASNIDAFIDHLDYDSRAILIKHYVSH